MSTQTIVRQNLMGELVIFWMRNLTKGWTVSEVMFLTTAAFLPEPTCPLLHAALPPLPYALSLLLPAVSSVPQFLHESCLPVSPMP